MVSAMLESLIATYGYLAVLLGTLAEGETALIGGGYAAHHGLLDLIPMMAAAFTGAFAGDQLFFYVGRRYGTRFVAKRRGWAKHVARTKSLLERHESVVVLSFRFLYGLRVLTPVALGMAGISYPKYLVLTAVSGVMWTALFGFGGYYLGVTMSHLLGNFEQLGLYGLAAILLFGCLLFGVRSLRKKAREGVSRGESGTRNLNA